MGNGWPDVLADLGQSPLSPGKAIDVTSLI
jgi:hypothetical protein